MKMFIDPVATARGTDRLLIRLADRPYGKRAANFHVLAVMRRGILPHLVEHALHISARRILHHLKQGLVLEAAFLDHGLHQVDRGKTLRRCF